MKSILEQALEAHLAGELPQAKQLYIEAIKLGTNDPAAHANLGHILKEEGALKEALIETNSALKKSPANPIFLMNAAGIHLELGHYRQAIELSERSLKIQPNNPIALANLGNAYQALGDLKNAEYFTIQSLNIQPDNIITLTTMGLIKHANNQLQEAFQAAQKALKYNPQLDQAHLLAGKVLQSYGDIMQAKVAFYNALKCNKNCTGALLALSLQRISSDEAKEILKIGELMTRERLSPEGLASLHYALSACHHKLRDYSRSQQSLKMAHQKKSQSHPSNKSEFIKAIHHFSSQSNTDPGINTSVSQANRVFIVGMPRSGSTLLESVLSIDDNIQDLGESTAMSSAIQDLIKISGTAITNPPTLEHLYSSYLQESLPQTNKITIDKQLHNFLYSGLIANNMPNAKIIHSRRNPLDNILSMLRTNLSPGYEYTISAGDSALVLIEQEKIMLQHKHQWPDRIYTFNYDHFVENPKKTIKRLITWLQIEWDEKFLHPENNMRPINTASVIQARQPINKKSLGGWRNYRDLLEPARQLILESELFNEFDLA